MTIQNIYTVIPVAPVVATNDADAATGNQSSKWGGINPVVATGATGNAAAGNGLLEVTATATYVQETIKKVIALDVSRTLTAGNNNFIVAPLANLGITTPKKVIGLTVLGVWDDASTETGATPTPSLIQVPEACVLSIIKDRLVLKVPTANIALIQANVVYIEVTFIV